MTAASAPPSMSVRVSRSGAEPQVVPLRAEDPMTVVIFGASGDLAKRKLIPALAQLQQGGYLPEHYAVIGFARTPMSDDAYRDAMRDALRQRAGDGVGTDDALVQALHYQAGDADQPASFQALKAKIEAYWRERGQDVMLSLHNVGFHPAIRAARYDVRSDMINGMPRSALKTAQGERNSVSVSLIEAETDDDGDDIGVED